LGVPLLARPVVQTRHYSREGKAQAFQQALAGVALVVVLLLGVQEVGKCFMISSMDRRDN
jgi:hypothetical protein